MVLEVGTPIYYRAGDQPNNALSLNVFHPGEVAATGGTSGVVYAVTDNLSVKESSRVNNFAHVNYQKGAYQYELESYYVSMVLEFNIVGY